MCSGALLACQISRIQFISGLNSISDCQWTSFLFLISGQWSILMKQDCFFLVRNIRIFLAMRKVNFSLFPSPVLLPQVAWNPMPKSAIFYSTSLLLQNAGPQDMSQGKKRLTVNMCVCACMLVSQLCPTLWDPMDYSPPGSSVHGNFLRRNTGVGCQFLLQGILPTQELNLGLSHFRQIL